MPEQLRTVLIIDDDPQFLLTLGAYLEDSGYMVIQANDGQEGVELFALHHPDIVVTDLRMPRMDGVGVLQNIKEQSPQTPLIIFTGTSGHYGTKQLEQQGAWCCLYKPLDDPRHLVFAIEMALAGKTADSFLRHCNLMESAENKG